MNIKHDKLFVGSITVIFVSLVILFLCFPRSTFSNVERRELAQFPEFSFEKLFKGKFTEEVGT